MHANTTVQIYYTDTETHKIPFTTFIYTNPLYQRARCLFMNLHDAALPRNSQDAI